MLKNLIKYGFSLILAQSFVLVCVAQQDLPSESQGDIQFYVDDASFYNNSKIYHEIYVMIFSDQLKLTSKNNSQYADLSLSLTVKKRNGDLVFKDSWDTEAEVILDTTKVNGMVVYDQWSQNFDSGNYLLELEVTDNLSGKSGTVRKEFDAVSSIDGNIFISDIEFASEIVKTDVAESIFNKGNVAVIPNPSRRYGILNPVVYFYYEIYNPTDEENPTVEVNYTIETNTGTSLKSFVGKTFNLAGATSGVPNGINVSAVASGIYQLIVKAKNTETGFTAVSRRNFEVIQLDYTNKQPALTLEQADMFGEIIRLISTEKNYALYESLNLSAKAKFLVNFWQQNDPYPTTDENELFDRITQRFQYANDKFSWGGISGWKSDRGKILIKYGMPDNIQRFPSEESTSPYVIWEYQERRSYVYVFGDLRDNGRYTLLHSTREGEIYNPYWKEELNRM